MKISLAPYALTPHRKGTLIRWEEGGVVGYADLHPWPELGDAPLEDQLKERNTPLWNRALTLARIDGAARSRKVNLFEGPSLPRSYLLVPDLKALEAASSAEVVKLKVGKDPEEEIKQLLALTLALAPRHTKAGVRLRLDFNNRLDKSAFEDYMQEISPLQELIDYIEDPYPYDPALWIKTGKLFKIPLALDAGSERGIGQTEAAPVLILKPARQSEKPFKRAIDAGQRVVVTSSLDHPLGQSVAAWVAAQFPEEICGLASHKVYPPNSFSKEIDHIERHFKAPEGTGFGFDQQLLELEWTDG